MKKIVLSSLVIAFCVGCFNVNAQQKNGKATFVKESHDFGTINESDGPVTYEFEFANTGTDPLVLKNVAASCGCTTPDWSREPILPGKKGHIKVTYNPQNRPGSFDKTITVSSDGNPGTQLLKINGVVVAKPQPAPQPVKADTAKKK